MSYRWKAEIHVWPHQTGRGREVDQKEAGDRERTFEVTAESIDEALSRVRDFRAGIETNPAVWQAPIISIRQL